MTRYMLVDRSGEFTDYFVRTQRQGPFVVRVWSRITSDAKRLTHASALKLSRQRPFRHCLIERAS